MAKSLKIEVKESDSELRKKLKSASPQQQKRIQMLLLIKKGTHLTKASLALALGVSDHSVQSWRTIYIQSGLDSLLEEKRGGGKKAQITEQAAVIIEKKLSNPSEGFSSYVEAQEWINNRFGLNMEYHAVNKFIKRRFAAKLKVGRKSHVLKDPTATAVFKKPSRKAKTY
jgi:hypothetical protein